MTYEKPVQGKAVEYLMINHFRLEDGAIMKIMKAEDGRIHAWHEESPCVHVVPKGMFQKIRIGHPQ